MRDFSWEFEKILQEGKYRAHEITKFDYNQKIGFYESMTNGTKKEIDLPGPLHDVLSAFYWFRTQEVRVGETLQTIVYADERNWELQVRVLRAERVELINVGVFDAIVIEPKASFKGVFVDRGRTRVYLTADARRVPLTR